MAFTPFAFDPPTGWNDVTVFPTYEASEAKVRSDMQKLHDQTRDYINDLVTQVGKNVLMVETTVSSLPTTISNDEITANPVVLRMELGTPTAQTSEWTVTTGVGTITISGTVSGSTTVKLVLSEVVSA